MSTSDGVLAVLAAILVGFVVAPGLFMVGIDRLCQKDEERMPTVDILGEVAEHAQSKGVPREYKLFDSSVGGATLTLCDRAVETFAQWAASLTAPLITGHVRDHTGMLHVSGYLETGSAINVYVTLPAGAMHDAGLVGVVPLDQVARFVETRMAVSA